MKYSRIAIIPIIICALAHSAGAITIPFLFDDHDPEDVIPYSVTIMVRDKSNNKPVHNARVDLQLIKNDRSLAKLTNKKGKAFFKLRKTREEPYVGEIYDLCVAKEGYIFYHFNAKGLNSHSTPPVPLKLKKDIGWQVEITKP